jgi:cytochrome c-type biogenesis protein CcmE
VAELTWEKSDQSDVTSSKTFTTERLKFLIGGLLLLGVVVYLIVSGTANGARYFITVDELVGNPEYVGQTVRITGAVVGDTITYDSRNLIIDFTIAHIPSETDDLALALHQAVKDTSVSRLNVHIEGEVMPDLLENEAQAILTGQLQPDGTFVATELLLKCPSRYEEAVPDQVGAESASS